MTPSRIESVAKAAVSLCGIGMLPVAPGTWGSLVVALPGLLSTPDSSMFLWAYAVAAVFFTVLGIVSIPHVQVLWGKDPGRVVIDEAAGMALVLATPLATSSPAWLLAAFVVFRVYDVAKPFPANVLDRRAEAWSVMADDLVAAVYTVVTIYLAQFVLHAAAPFFAG